MMSKDFYNDVQGLLVTNTLELKYEALCFHFFLQTWNGVLIIMAVRSMNEDSANYY